MTLLFIPQQYKKHLDVDLNEEVHIIKNNQQPATIIFTRNPTENQKIDYLGTIKEYTIIYPTHEGNNKKTYDVILLPNACKFPKKIQKQIIIPQNKKATLTIYLR